MAQASNMALAVGPKKYKDREAPTSKKGKKHALDAEGAERAPPPN